MNMLAVITAGGYILLYVKGYIPLDLLPQFAITVALFFLTGRVMSKTSTDSEQEDKPELTDKELARRLTIMNWFFALLLLAAFAGMILMPPGTDPVHMITNLFQ